MDYVDENDICCLMQEDIKRRDLPRAALLDLIVSNPRIFSVPLLDP